jgi:large subunit ribosomal protein L24
MSQHIIKTGDTVKVITGSDKGKTGKVMQVFPKLNRVVVQGVNAMKRHLHKRREGEKGQIIEFFMPIHRSNVKRIEESEVPVTPEEKVETKPKVKRTAKPKTA